MNEQLVKEGMDYAEKNFLDEESGHLFFDKKLIRNRYDLNGKNILDFGCGMGGMSLWYARHWDCNVKGLDVDANHISIANRLKNKYKLSNVNFSRQNILKKIPSEKYDVVFMKDVAEHISEEILSAIFSTLKHVLKDEGVLFISYPPWTGPYASHLNHVIKIPWVQYFPKNWLEKMIDKHNHPIVGDLESDLKSAFNGLNKLTHKKLKPLLESHGFRLSYRKQHSLINKMSMFENINLGLFPLNYLVSKEFTEWIKQ